MRTLRTSLGNNDMAIDTRTEVTSNIIFGNSGNSGNDVVFTSLAENSFLSGGHNLIGSGNATTAFDGLLNDIVSNADPLLSPLAYYSGPTPTMALRPGSPARNAGSPLITIPDQRGFNPFGSRDIGAYEAGATSGAHFSKRHLGLPSMWKL